jgi:NAD(P)-dependent dehydrogenase (short-subunit alcohol dehydrogenase family)
MHAGQADDADQLPTHRDNLTLPYMALCFQELATSLKSSPGKLHALKCDITKENEVQAAFKWIKTNLGGADILINNAGAAYSSKLISTYSDSQYHQQQQPP